VDQFSVQQPSLKVTKTLHIGLADEGETPEMTAIRELEEETGFKASGVFGSSPLLWSDPGMSRIYCVIFTRMLSHLRIFPDPLCRHDYGDDEDGYPGRTCRFYSR
jgi:8-oxo-dGTP pyrophosphatase MutT (NUDIX family)